MLCQHITGNDRNFLYFEHCEKISLLSGVDFFYSLLSGVICNINISFNIQHTYYVCQSGFSLDIFNEE